MEIRTVFYVSDNTAVSVHNMGQSLLTQFQSVNFRQVFRPFIDNTRRAHEVAEEVGQIAKVEGAKPIVFSSLVNEETRRIVLQSGGLVFDIYDAFLQKIEGALSLNSTPSIGRSHRIIDEASYDVRINAVNYTLAHDDGITTKNYDKADVIITGLSRTGKTPTCVYLAIQFGIYAANYPMTEDDFFSADKNLSLMLSPYHSKLFGLSIDADRLHAIRHARRPNSRYSSLKQCQLEVRMAEDFFNSERIPYVNITKISVEEIAANIMHEKKLQRRVG
ncbi:MAG: kinase/pyrophosphorylase [Deltaproteobacteria bacterium]|nr:kinase/pyrophosphorylase [Deltaproteobacteria bacterium]